MAKRVNLGPLLLAIAGAAVSGYLTYVHYNQGALVCGIGDCDIVQASQYSTIFDIPIAILGLLMFIALIALFVIRATMTQWQDLANMAIMILLISSVIYFAYLTWLELFVIDAICQWCVITAIITLVLIIVEGLRMASEIRQTNAELALDEE